MKFRVANELDLVILKEIWYECFLEHDSKASIDYYFENSFDLEHTFILEVDQEIVCSLQLNQHQIMYQGKEEAVSFVIGVATPIIHRKKGYMRVLLNKAIEYAQVELNQNYMILQAYNWDIYRSFGFYEAYFKKEVFFTIEDLKDIVASKQEVITSKGLLELYQSYTSKLDGYKIRDLEYYDKMLKMYLVEEVDVYLSSEAYLIYYVDEYIEVSECAYLSEDGLKEALKSLSDQYQKSIRLKVDNTYQSEDQLKIIYMMVKDLNKEFKIYENLYISEEI